MISDWHNKTVWIIGASSGIGYALAVALSERGARLILTARRENELNTLAGKLGSNVSVLAIDISDDAAIDSALVDIKQHHQRIDCVLCLAGAYEPTKIADLDYTSQRLVIDTNLHGTINIIRHVLPVMKAQNNGLIAIYGSVAGYNGLPAGQPYSASKAALINFAESLRLESEDDNIDIKIINSGFVDTPLTQKNTFNMPMMVSTESAADSIIKGLGRKAFEIHFPRKFTYLMKLLRLLPYWLYFLISGRAKS